MLSNAYFLAKFRFDTAENEPAKNLQNFRKNAFSKNAFSKIAFSKMKVPSLRRGEGRVRLVGEVDLELRGLEVLPEGVDEAAQLLQLPRAREPGLKK